MKDKKDLEVVSGNVEDLDITPVYDYLNVAKPQSSNNKPKYIVVPKEKSKKDDDDEDDKDQKDKKDKKENSEN